jgi:hypothetical protein
LCPLTSPGALRERRDERAARGDFGSETAERFYFDGFARCAIVATFAQRAGERGVKVVVK